MTNLTAQYKTLNNHINHNGGAKTVCVTTCLNFFNIPFDGYYYTSSKTNNRHFKNVLRRFGYSVRSRKSEFKIKKYPTMTAVRRQLKKSNYTDQDFFIVHGLNSRAAHLMVLNGNGEMIIDTAPCSRWNIVDIAIVEKK